MGKIFQSFCYKKFAFLIVLFSIVKSDEIQADLGVANTNMNNFNDQFVFREQQNRQLEDVPPEQTEVKFIDMFLSPSMIRNFIMLFAARKLSKGPEQLQNDIKLRMIDMDQDKVQLAMLNSNIDHDVEEVNSLLLKAMDSLDFYQSKILGEIMQYKGIAEGYFSRAIKLAQEGGRLKKRKLRRKRKLNTLKIQNIRNNDVNDLSNYNNRKLDISKNQLEEKIQKLDQELKLRNQILQMEEKIRKQIDQKDKLSDPKV